jgi:hypothetical protein
MAKITYDDKVALNEEPSVAEINKVTDDNMNEIKSSVNDIYDNALVNKGIIPNNTDLNDLTEEGVYYTAGNTFVNGPTINYNWSQIIVINQGGLIQQIFIKPVDGAIQIREHSGSPAIWSSWKLVQYDSGWKEFTLNSGFTNAWGNYNSSYRKDGNVVNVMMAINFTSVPAWGTTIATLPDGFRPVTEYDVFCRAANNNDKPVLIGISSTGNINYLQATGTISASNTLVISATFIAA